MLFDPISKECGHYEILLDADKKVYPTNEPVTPKILDNWFENDPRFGMFFRRKRGMCISIPLNKNGWNKLITGQLEEANLDHETIFNPKRDSEIGIHIYHIEKSKNAPRNFYKDSLKSIKKILKSTENKNNKRITVIGFSGLCVTPQGIGLFEDKFSCKESAYISNEYILKKNDTLKVFVSNSKEDLKNKTNNGFELINRCKMLVLQPEDKSIVWDYLS